MATFLSRLLRRTPNVTGRLPRPRFLPRAAALLVSGTVLVLLASSVADHPADLPSWLDPFGWVLTRIRYVTAGIGELFAGEAAAAGARIEFFVVAFGVIISLRWLKFWWLTIRPGPIEVVLLEDATVDSAGLVAAGEPTSEANTALRTYVTMMLREKLSSVTVYLPTPAPGDAVGGGFLQTMRESTRETWWGTVIEFVSRIIPRSAYRVDGAVLRRQDHEDSYGVAVRITVFPRQRTVANTVWARTPEQAAECAARVVAAAILPLTRRCLSSPWRHWHGRRLPVELLADYEAASAYREQRRYDEALGHYRAALERDSLNPSIRLEMAQIQEQLGLYLDALATYDNALTLWSGSPERYNSWLHRTRRFTAWQRLSRWRRYGNPFVARYRYATALAYFEKLTPQWVKPEGKDPRSRERSRLRHLLVTKLAERYGPVMGGAAELKATLNRLTKGARPDGSTDGGQKAKAELSRLFLEMSRYELRQLVRDHRSWLGWADSSDLTTRSLRLARDSWIDVRLQVAKRGLEDADGSEVRDDEVVELLAGLPDRIGRTTRRSKGWMDHYNAACTYGQVLVLVGRVEEHRDFARAAVKHLFTGLESVDSSHVSRQQSWILSEDSDLRELRRCSEFQPFAAAIGPAGGAVVLRPRRTQIAELGEYEMNLLIECTHTMEARLCSPDSRVDDAHAWWTVHQLAMAHRNWPDRLDAIAYFRDRPADARPWEVALPDFATFSPPDAVNDDADLLDKWSDELIKRDNLCAILAALWIRGQFQVDLANKTFLVPAGAADRADCWRELRAVVTHAHLERTVPTGFGVRAGALQVIEKANERIPGASPVSAVVDWEDQAWRWAEEQRVDHPNDGTGSVDVTNSALARAFAAVAIAYEGVGDSEAAWQEAKRLSL